MIKKGQRVEITYPAHAGESGVITVIVPRKDSPALLNILLDSGAQFICDETMVK